MPLNGQCSRRLVLPHLCFELTSRVDDQSVSKPDQRFLTNRVLGAPQSRSTCLDLRRSVHAKQSTRTSRTSEPVLSKIAETSDPHRQRVQTECSRKMVLRVSDQVQIPLRGDRIESRRHPHRHYWPLRQDRALRRSIVKVDGAIRQMQRHCHQQDQLCRIFPMQTSLTVSCSGVIQRTSVVTATKGSETTGLSNVERVGTTCMQTLATAEAGKRSAC